MIESNGAASGPEHLPQQCLSTAMHSSTTSRISEMKRVRVLVRASALQFSLLADVGSGEHLFYPVKCIDFQAHIPVFVIVFFWE